MNSYIKPEDMDAVQKMKYISIVSKVCKELDTHLGFSEKSVAEFLISMAMESRSEVEFNKKLHQNEVPLEMSFTDQLYGTILYLYPKVKTNAVGATTNQPLSNMEKILPGLAMKNTEPVKFDAYSKTTTKHSSRSSRSRSKSSSRSHTHTQRSHRSRSRSSSSHRSYRRSHLHHERHERRELAVNEIYNGCVRSVMDYGAFVEITEVYPVREGLVHVSNIAHERIGHPSDILKRNQRIKVKVTQIAGNKISLNMKDVNQITGDDQTVSHSLHTISHQIQPELSNQPVQSIRRKRMSSWERFEFQQLVSSGVLTPEDQRRYMDQYEDGGIEETMKVEESIEVVVSEKIAPFLAGATLSNVLENDEPTKIMKKPQGSLARAALTSAAMLQERKDLRSKQRRDEQSVLPSGSLTSFDDPLPDGGIHLLASEVRAMSQHPVSLSSLSSSIQQSSSSSSSSSSRHKLPQVSRKHMSIAEQRRSLPVYERREQLLQAIRDSTVLVVEGETGSGKTTQMTQYIIEAGLNGGKIVGCTQPRRVAATSVAARVAEEVGCRVGEEVGYSVRFNDRTSNRTVIKYMTDGMLMREYLMDGMLSKYSVLILDEAHERTLYTDVLFALLKALIKKRRDLKLIITSATLDVMRFSQYYNNCPILNIKGRTFPVTTYYLSTPEPNYVESALQTVWDINKDEPPGDVLIFLTGQEEIEYVCESLEERQRRITDDSIPPMLICPVFGAQSNDQQQSIFQPTPPGMRKVVIATNIAEASLTIDGIYYVIDSGFCKQSVYNPKTGMDQLIVTPISKDSAKQRKGRAGRTGPGKCYRLYTKQQKQNEMLSHTIPEIQRANLDNVVLQMKAMGINDLLNFDFLDPPSSQALVKAMERLYTLDSLDDDGLLTPLGTQMAAFPLSPQLSKSLLTSVQLGCSGEILIVVSMLSEESLFIRPKDKQAQADQKHAMLFAAEGDQITYLTIFQNWAKNGKSKKWCDDRYLQERALRRADDIRSQLERIMIRFNMSIVYCGHDYKSIQKSIVSGYFTNVAKRDTEGYKSVLDSTIVHLHPSSSLKGREPEWVCYGGIRMTSREYMMNVMTIDPKWLIELAPKFYRNNDGKKITKEQKEKKILPVFNYRMPDDSWRMSKRKGQFYTVC